MNTKVESAPERNTGDIAKLALAIVLLLGGLYAFYFFDQVSTGVRGVGMLLVVIAALAISAFTAIGRATREFLTESQFELRKVVWPTRQETLQTTLAVGVVVIILSIVLWLIDLFLGWVILQNLLKSG